MNRIAFVVLVGIGVCGMAVTPIAQSSLLSSEILEDWQRMRQLMMSTANAMPEDKFDYASTPEQRNWGEQILHVAGGNVFLMGFLGGETPAPMIDRRNFRTFGHTATSKAEILEILSQSFDYGEAVLREFDDDGLLEHAAGPPFLGSERTRLRVANFVIGHQWDIYGQMVVYLRLNGIVPPASSRGV